VAEGKMFFDKPEGRSYLAIAYLSILVGIFIAVYGGLAWLINCYTQESSFYFPAAKLMGGILIAQLGYILLELEIMRKKK